MATTNGVYTTRFRLCVIHEPVISVKNQRPIFENGKTIRLLSVRRDAYQLIFPNLLGLSWRVRSQARMQYCPYTTSELMHMAYARDL